MQMDFIIEKISNIGIYTPLIFILVYAIATVVFLPGLMLTMAGGFLFGPILGTFYNIVGAVIGSSISFFIARIIGEKWFASKLKGKLKQIKEGVEQQGWKFVAVVRLTPIVPFNLANYALGLTKVKFLSFAAASFVFMLPACFAYTYLGSLGKDALETGLLGLINKIFIAIGLVVMVSIIPWLLKKFKNR